MKYGPLTFLLNLKNHRTRRITENLLEATKNFPSFLPKLLSKTWGTFHMIIHWLAKMIRKFTRTLQNLVNKFLIDLTVFPNLLNIPRTFSIIFFYEKPKGYVLFVTVVHACSCTSSGFLVDLVLQLKIYAKGLREDHVRTLSKTLKGFSQNL